MSNRIPIEVDAFHKSLNAAGAAYAYLCLDDSYRLKFSGGDTKEFSLNQLNTNEPVPAQIEFLEGLLPCTGSEVVLIANIQYMKNRYTDIHLFRIQEGQCVLFIDRTASGRAKQVEQQQQLGKRVG